MPEKKKKLDIVYCPECGDTPAAGRLVVRTNKKTGHDFLGCSNFPACKYTEELEDAEDDREFYNGSAPPWDEASIEDTY